jgi:hypothetical protein
VLVLARRAPPAIRQLLLRSPALGREGRQDAARAPACARMLLRKPTPLDGRVVLVYLKVCAP